MSNFIIIFSFFSFGLLAQRLLTLPTKLPLTLNQLVINIAIPAVILLRIPQLTLTSALIFPIVAAWLTVAIAAFFVQFFARKFQWPRPVIGALLMTAVLGNTSYLGFPMVKMFYGEALLPYAIIFDQLGNFIALAIYGTLIVSLFSDGEKAPTSKQIAIKILRFPPFITLLLALMLPADVFPEIVNTLLGVCALAMVPLTMFIVGLQFQLQLDPHYRKPLMFGLGIKMLITPILILAITIVFPINSDIAKVSVFESAMPPMVTAGVMAIQANLAPKLATAMVGFGLFLSFILLPLVYWLNALLLV